MKNNPILEIFARLLALVALLFLAAGCATPGSSSATAKGLPGARTDTGETLRSFAAVAGPIVLRRVQAEGVERYLKRHPGKVQTLLGLATALETLAGSSSSADISEAAIRAWVAAQAPKLDLIEGEEEDLVQILLLAREAARNALGGVTLQLGDPRVAPWLRAVASGLRAGVARVQAVGKPSAEPPAPRLTVQRYPKETALDPAGHMALQVAAPPEYAYVVEVSEDLVNWREMTRQPIGTGSAVAITGLSGLPERGFFRVRYWKSIDADEFANLGSPLKFSLRAERRAAAQRQASNNPKG